MIQSHQQPAACEERATLDLKKSAWKDAAKKTNMSITQWASSSLDFAAENQITERVDLLDDLDFYVMSNGQTPLPFQVAAIRHWIGLTQTKAANLINTRLSTYRNCESVDECVLMDSDRWGLYVEKATTNLLAIEYKTLPNAFGRSMRGLSGLTYRQLNDVSNLSQSYWTTRLRFKYPPAPIEIESIDELVKIVIKVIEHKVKSSLFHEAKAMLKSLLYFAYETQKARTILNAALVSPMHIIKTTPDATMEAGNHTSRLMMEDRGSLDIEQTNLYARTVEILAENGFCFSPTHRNIAFTEIK